MTKEKITGDKRYCRKGVIDCQAVFILPKVQVSRAGISLDISGTKVRGEKQPKL
jgi:hypothetical protein